jgi:hypothetical protein
MAADILKAIVMNAPIKHEPKHDIESIIHVLGYALIDSQIPLRACITTRWQLPGPGTTRRQRKDAPTPRWRT